MSTSTSDPKHAAVVTGYPAPAPAPAPVAVPETVAGTPAIAAASYPCPAPPPYAVAPYYYQCHHQFSNAVQQPPPSYYPSGSDPYSVQSSSVRRIFAFAVVLFLLGGFASMLFWVVVRPRIPEVTLSSVSLSAFNLSAPTLLSADFSLAFTFHNPNSKMNVYYDQLEAAAFYDGENLANTALPPFYQSTGNTADVRARLVAANTYVNPDAARGIEADSSTRDGAVRFQFAAIAWVQFRSGVWWTRWHAMRVSCDDVWIGTQNATASVDSNRSVPQRCLVIM